MKLTVRLGLIMATIFLGVCVLSAQRTSTTWLKVSGSKPDTKPVVMTFGVDTAATYGIDSVLGELIAPPKPPTGILDAHWLDPRLDMAVTSSSPWPDGLFLRDLRKYTGRRQVDTFEVTFQPDSAFVTLHWAKKADLQLECDSMKMSDNLNAPDAITGLFYNVDMFSAESLQVKKANQVSSVFIIRYGEVLTTGVKRESRTAPASFALRQNYPNPFNPTTTITFDVAKSAITEITVYDMLGRKVATLASGQLNPGTFSTQWNGRDERNQAVGSGVYYARMTAHAVGGNSNEEFSAVRKLMLMK